MPNVPFESPVEDSVPKVNEELAVGEDLEFQRKWWRFEKIIWPILALLVLVDMLGGFGRGWLAKAKTSTPDHAMTVDYEHVVRTGTPSIMLFSFGDAAIHDGKITLYLSESVVKQLGAQRIAPQPLISTIGDGGITYVISGTRSPASVQIQLQPSFPGMHKFRAQVEGSPPIQGSVFVMP